MEQLGDATRHIRDARERFSRDVRRALGQVPPEVAESAVGHAVLAESLVRIAAEILVRQGNVAFLGELVRTLHGRFAQPAMRSGGREGTTL